MSVTKNCAAEIEKAKQMYAQIEEKRATNPEQTAAFFVSPKAMEYFGGVLEVERVAQRIAGSLNMRGTDVGLEEETKLMAAAVRYIDSQWRALATSLAAVGTLQFSADVDNAAIQQALAHATNASRVCHLCYVALLPSDPTVDWEGAPYHAGCGNFWRNRIQQTPPPSINN
jgi:hypothetical protein